MNFTFYSLHQQSPGSQRGHRFWRRFYDALAFAYDAVLAVADRLGLGSEGRIRRQVLATLPLVVGTRVLDLGCGTGASRPFLPAEIDYFAVDSSRGMLRRAASKCAAAGYAAHWVQADARALPFAAECLDLALAIGVMQHVAQPVNAISEVQRVARPGGRLLLIDERGAQGRIMAAWPSETVQPQPWGEYFVLDLVF